ncbi:hypothetical protein EMCRGX_G025844 [Ephydatia muelleri]
MANIGVLHEMQAPRELLEPVSGGPASNRPMGMLSGALHSKCWPHWLDEVYRMDRLHDSTCRSARHFHFLTNWNISHICVEWCWHEYRSVAIQIIIHLHHFRV